MANQSKLDRGLFLIVVALFGWAVPGGGYLLIKETKRAVIIFVVITATFLMGIYIGSIGVIDPVEAWPWYIGQIMTSPAVALLANLTETHGYKSYGRPCDVGQIYTAIAGALNLLCIVSAMYLAHSGKERVFEEEKDAE